MTTSDGIGADLVAAEEEAGRAAARYDGACHRLLTVLTVDWPNAEAFEREEFQRACDAVVASQAEAVRAAARVKTLRRTLRDLTRVES